MWLEREGQKKRMELLFHACKKRWGVPSVRLKNQAEPREPRAMQRAYRKTVRTVRTGPSRSHCSFPLRGRSNVHILRYRRLHACHVLSWPRRLRTKKKDDRPARHRVL